MKLKEAGFWASFNFAEVDLRKGIRPKGHISDYSI